ncbi:MAG: translation initiation factor [Epsilonproteobacteria bacterium]|nr:translation initiation factor [Campylobacterota bacterium]
MSRGTKLDLFIGAEIEDGWAEVVERKSEVSSAVLEPSKHMLVFKREKRRGKVVTLVGEFHMPQNDCKAQLKEIKKLFGCGGTYNDGWMEFQGELQEKLKAELQKRGFRFKK